MDTTKPRADEFVATRTFDAPLALVWKAYTELDHLKRWMAFGGGELKQATLDFRPGGSFHFAMPTPHGQDMWQKFSYREIHPMTDFTYTYAFSDASGAILGNPWSPDWPKEILTTLHFEENGGKTTVTLTGSPLDATDKQRDAFLSQIDSLAGGAKGALEGLAKYLASIQ